MSQKQCRIKWRWEVRNTKRQFNRAYILLESLIALSLLTAITTIMLSEINSSQKQADIMNKRIETVNLAEMALDAKVTHLAGNGVSVDIDQSSQFFKVKDKTGKEVLKLEILEVQK